MSSRDAAHAVQQSAGWLDTHAEACRPEYTAMVEWAALPTGRVLDAGTGAGWFVEHLRGAGAAVVAVDNQPALVAGVRARTGPAVDGVAADVRSLPFGAGAFDAVWMANTLQYFDDPEAADVLRECARVVRPGGLVAVKDVDMAMFATSHVDPFVYAHLSEASIRRSLPESVGSLRGRLLRRHLEAAGLVEVRQRTFAIERWAPLTAPEQELWITWLQLLAGLALERDVPEEDRPAWQRFLDAGAADHPVRAPDFYCCEGQVVAVGRRPQAG